MPDVWNEKLMDIENDVCDIHDIVRIVKKNTGTEYTVATVRLWFRQNRFKTMCRKGNNYLVARWEVEQFTPPPRGVNSHKSKRAKTAPRTGRKSPKKGE